MSKASKSDLVDSNDAPSILWFRQDLRVADNPALLAAISRKAPLIPIYLWSPEDEEEWAPGAASRVWLHQSLLALNEELEKLGSCLIIRQGNALKEILTIVKETKAGAVFWNRRYEPAVIAKDKAIEESLKKSGSLIVESFNGSLLYEPWQIMQKNNKPYQVYTAFWRACLNRGEMEAPLKKPSALLSPNVWPKSISLDKLQLVPKIKWANEIVDFWTPGTASANLRLKKFVAENIGHYRLGRNRPDLESVSYLSPYLHLGQLSPRQIVQSVQTAIERSDNKDFVDSAQIYLKEIFWREFAYHLLFHFPHTTDKSLRDGYSEFSWQFKEKNLRAWQAGQTGYPIVDAGMRQLLKIGWMHNRVRMIVASFLVKDLLIPWQLGAKWFWDTLVDADLANNTLGWQWSAGCGADAVPYFRVFNPISQGQKFDPDGIYIKSYIPELKSLDKKYIHAPWLADAGSLLKAKIVLGKDYPEPMVDHSKARLAALAVWRQLREDGNYKRRK